jgi:hypothetical protein
MSRTSSVGTVKPGWGISLGRRLTLPVWLILQQRHLEGFAIDGLEGQRDAFEQYIDDNFTKFFVTVFGKVHRMVRGFCCLRNYRFFSGIGSRAAAHAGTVTAKATLLRTRHNRDHCWLSCKWYRT